MPRIRALVPASLAALVMLAAQGAPSVAQTGDDGVLSAKRENVEVVGKLRPTARFGDVAPNQIGDLALHGGAAYLMSGSEPGCTRGGVYVVDLTDPAAPKEGPFIPARLGTFHGDGAHARRLSTGAFTGDVLAVGNEPCSDQGSGGFDLYDVTNPADPKVLVQGFGDSNGSAVTHPYRSVHLWQAGGRAFLVAADQLEFTDLDVFDVTDPRAPQLVTELDLMVRFPQISDDLALDGTSGLEEVTVREIGGRQVMFASYGDAGHVKLDVTDPANPEYVGDTTFDGADPLLPAIGRPAGNAHQAQLSAGGGHLLAADEDLVPYRVDRLAITTGANAGDVHAAADVPGATSPATLLDGVLNGPVVYGGYGCKGSDSVPLRSGYDFELSTGEEAILVLQRGPSGDPQNTEETCSPGEKAASAKAAGWDAVVLVNRHRGQASSDAADCGGGGFTADSIPATCTTHTAYHQMFSDSPNYELPYQPNTEPDVGEDGERVRATPVFDGWGYGHLYENGSGKLREIGQYAIAESRDPLYAFGFGHLSIHEWATDATEPLAYAAYRAGGLRVAAYGPSGLQEVGAFIDQGGSDVWGVGSFTTSAGERLIAISDRDDGLYLVRYTGAGAPRPPACQPQLVRTGLNVAVTVQLSCSDVNGNPLTLSVAGHPANGSLGTVAGSTVTYTPKKDFRGVDSFSFQASDGAASSAAATVTVQVGPCSNRIQGTAAADILTGTEWHDEIAAGAGNDKVEAGTGDDCVAGEAGDDQLTGGDGVDTLTGGGGRDRLFGGAGADPVQGDAGKDHIRGSSGNDRLVGGTGDDNVSGGSNDDVLTGGSGNDSLRGDAGNDRIDGGSGNDAIATGAGKNRVTAGKGKDRVNAVNGATDRVNCGKGRDTVRADRRDRISKSCERVKRIRPARKRRR